MNFFPVPPITPAHKIVNGYRFEQYRQWLEGIPFRYALLVDFRDAYFQRDPFVHAEDFMHDCDLYLMSEFKFLTVGTSSERHELWMGARRIRQAGGGCDRR